MIQDDAALVAQVLSGAKSAFGLLIDQHWPGAMRLARRLLNDSADAEDVVQEALLQAFLCLRDLRNPDRFGAWLLGIVVNLCRMGLRARHDVYAFEDWYGGRLVHDLTWADLQPSPEVLYETRELHRLVLDAIATLPAEQQQAVRLHYIEGLTLREIAVLVGVPVGTIKARLHRARARLRREVVQVVADAPESIPPTEAEVSMIEVTVHDIIVRAPKSEVAKWTGPQDYMGKLGPQCIVLLKELAGERILPIWVGRFEASALALQLNETSTPRPMTYDLMARLLEVAEVRVEKVAVISLRENTFYATIWVRVGERVHEVDARPSDALTLGLRLKAPIFATPEVLEQTRVSFALTGSGYVLHLPDGQQAQGPELKILLEERHRKDMEEKGLPPEAPEMEYLSFRSLPRGDLGSQAKQAAK
jgi:RNA polymerase sigma factor (sigma-70 family)